MIECRDLKKIYGQGRTETPALRGVTFVIGEGERVAVTGKSGCGKSTLLALMAALDLPTSAMVKVGRRDLPTLGPRDRALYRFHHVGTVFQEFYLLDRLTVIENVLAPFLGRPLERRSHQDRARDLLRAVGMEAASLSAPTNPPWLFDENVAVRRSRRAASSHHGFPARD